MNPDDFLLVWSTCPDRASADALAQHLVGEQIAACVTVLPGAVSNYRWQGKVETSVEVVLMIKARRSAWTKLESEVRSHHPYDVPELVAVPFAEASKPYMQWIEESTE